MQSSGTGRRAVGAKVTDRQTDDRREHLEALCHVEHIPWDVAAVDTTACTEHGYATRPAPDSAREDPTCEARFRELARP